jgi:hypothetical protein
VTRPQARKGEAAGLDARADRRLLQVLPRDGRLVATPDAQPSEAIISRYAASGNAFMVVTHTLLSMPRLS